MRLMFIKKLPEKGPYAEANKEFNELFSIGSVFNAFKVHEKIDIISEFVRYRLHMKAPYRASGPLFGNYPIYESELSYFREIK